MTYAAGEVGQAFSFDGVNDFVSIANTESMDFGTGDFTIDFWFNLNSLSKLQTFIHKVVGTVPNDRTYFVEFNTPNALRFMVRDTADNQNDFIVPTNLVTGRWYHVAAVTAGNHQPVISQRQLDRVENSRTQREYRIGWYSKDRDNCPERLGSFPTRSGRIDEVELFNSALTPGEIKAIFDARSSGLCQP